MEGGDVEQRRRIWPRACLASAAASSVSAAYQSLIGAPILRRSAWAGLNVGLGTGVYLLFRDRLDEAQEGTEVTKSFFAGTVTGALLGAVRGSPATSMQCAVFVGGLCASAQFTKDIALHWVEQPPSGSLENLRATFASMLPVWMPVEKTDPEQVALFMQNQSTMQSMMRDLDEFEKRQSDQSTD